MKRLFLLVIPFLPISCSDDAPKGELVKTHTRLLHNYESFITEYSDGRPTKIKYYIYDEYGGYAQYLYNEKGIIIAKNQYWSSGSQNSITYSYDALDRLIQKVETSTETKTSTFQYNEDDTITELIALEGSTEPFQRTYYLDANDLVYKIASTVNTIELTYDGLNIVSIVQQGQITNLEYNEDSDRTLLGLQPIGGSYKPNSILILGVESGVEEMMTKYMDKRDGVSYVTKFTSDGLPTESNTYTYGQPAVLKYTYR